jgi:hypothetical protein
MKRYKYEITDQYDLWKIVNNLDNNDTAKYLKAIYSLDENDDIVQEGNSLFVYSFKHILLQNQDTISFNKQEFNKLLIEVMDLGMSLRQNQLNGLTDISGTDALKNFLKRKNIQI